MMEFVLNYILTLCTRCACHPTLSEVFCVIPKKAFYVISKIYEIHEIHCSAKIATCWQLM